MKKYLALVIIVVIIVCSGCNDAANPGNVAYNDMAIHPPIGINAVVNYQNGVYYFPFTESEYGNALSLFNAIHPELEVTAMSPNDTGGYGRTVGYFVTFRVKDGVMEKTE
ncbi:MAG: hypothetical protein Q7K65_04585 [Candidatus Buchananbacteria bacterium]|nr:hypothetical protein [Candidatus Buchananbacteria bacterium]